MAGKFDVLVLGELNIDIILNYIEGLPELGKEKLARKMDIVLGSSSAILASNLSSLGKRVAFLGKIGNDAYGQIILDNLRGAGVDTSLIIKSDNHNTGATVVLNYGEDRAMVTFPGAMEYLTMEDITAEILLQVEHLHFSSYFLQPGLKSDLPEVFKKAKDLGLSTSLDPQWDPKEEWRFDYPRILPYVDIFLPNKMELLNISGTQNLQDGIDKLKQWSNCLIIKNGSEGSIGWINGELIIVDPYSNQQVVDAIGAGDSFNAGFISKFIDGSPISKCMLFGNLMGAVSTTASGGTGAFKDLDSVMKIALEKFDFVDR